MSRDPLDALVDSLASSDFEVTRTMCADTDREHPNSRLAMYKNRGRNMLSNQDMRRRALLEHQKKRRAATLDVARALVDGDVEESDEEEMEATDEASIVRKYRVRASYKKQLMLSEWMEQVPNDLDTEWLIVPVPEGKRTLVVAGGGRTRRFTRGGYDLGDFKCVLGYKYKETILDCIFVPAQGTFYVLDVMTINGHPLYECDTVTRFEWGKQQVLEVDGIGERRYGGRRQNNYAFRPLQHYPADSTSIANILSDENQFCFTKDMERRAHLDGILFYHKRLNYMPGHTPLVSWLKGYMVPEMLNIPVSDGLMAQKPVNYRGMQGEIEQFEKEYAQKKEKIKAKEENRRQNKKRFSSDGNFNRLPAASSSGEFPSRSFLADPTPSAVVEMD